MEPRYKEYRQKRGMSQDDTMEMTNRIPAGREDN